MDYLSLPWLRGECKSSGGEGRMGWASHVIAVPTQEQSKDANRTWKGLLFNNKPASINT